MIYFKKIWNWLKGPQVPPPFVGKTFTITTPKEPTNCGLSLEQANLLKERYKKHIIHSISQLNNAFDQMLIPGTYECEVDKNGKVKFLGPLRKSKRTSRAKYKGRNHKKTNRKVGKKHKR